MGKRGYQVSTLAVLGALLFLSFIFNPSDVRAQGIFPEKPITLVIGYGAGGGTDISTRVLSDLASKILGQPIVVINKPGGTSSVALAAGKLEKTDGYNLVILPSGGIMTSLIRKVPYDPATDFTPIIQFGSYQDGIAVLADSPWKTFKDYIEDAKKNPGKIRWASAGVGTPEALIMESLGRELGINWKHIPYDAGPQTAAALLGGHVDALADSSLAWKAHVDSGKFRLLATFHEARMKTYPNVPTVLELGYNKKAASLISIVGPKGIPEPIVDKIHGAYKKAMEDPNFIKTMDKIGYLISYRDPKELKKYIQEIVKEEGEMVKKLGLRK